MPVNIFLKAQKEHQGPSHGYLRCSSAEDAFVGLAYDEVDVLAGAEYSMACMMDHPLKHCECNYARK